MRRAAFAAAVLGCWLAAAPAAIAKIDVRVDSAVAQLRGPAGERIVVSGARRDVILSVEREGDAAMYASHGRGTPKRLRASLGPYGVLDLTFEPQGPRRFVREPGTCAGGTYVQRGVFSGQLEYAGDPPYSPVSTTTVRGKVLKTRVTCDAQHPPTPTEPGQDQGVALHADDGTSDAAVSFDASRLDGERKVSFVASAFEAVDGVAVLRSVVSRAPRSTFQFDLRGRTATVTPPPPFAGSAKFDSGSWRGDLSAVLPNGTPLALTGPGFKATLYRATFFVVGEWARAAQRLLARL
jgi:hypothetical protein